MPKFDSINHFYMRKSFTLFFLLVSVNLFAQKVSRDPDSRKDFANVFYKPQYTLFDLWSDEPIFPSSDGNYYIYYATNENKTPKRFVGTSSELSNITVYKFKNFQNCDNWCKGIQYTKNKTGLSTKSAKNMTNSSKGSNNTKNTAKNPYYDRICDWCNKSYFLDLDRLYGYNGLLGITYRSLSEYNSKFCPKRDRDDAKLQLLMNPYKVQHLLCSEKCLMEHKNSR